MTELRRLLQDYAVFLVLLGASVGGHYWFVFVHREPAPLVIRVPISDVQGVTRVAIQIVAARPKPTLEVPEPVNVVKPVETPEPMPLELAKVELPLEKTITAQVPRPKAPSAPPPPPAFDKVEEEEMPPVEKPPEPPRKRKQNVAQLQEQPEIKSLNDQNFVQDAAQGSESPVTALVCPKPPYPVNLWRRSIESKLELAVRIDVTGKPYNVTVWKSSGYLEFDRSAIDTVTRLWKFSPKKLADGRPVEDYVTLPFSFKLNDAKF